MSKQISNSEQLFKEYPTLSLKKVCDTLGLCYQYVLKASKQPKAGEQYDPSAVNYEAIDNIVSKKSINLADTDWDEIVATIKVFEPVNKPEDFELGVRFKIRGEENPMEVVYLTETHIVFKDTQGTQPRVMNWDTFLHQSPRIISK